MNEETLCSGIRVVFTAALILPAFAAGWYCPSCGRYNDNNFCPKDGTQKPSNLEANAKGRGSKTGRNGHRVLRPDYSTTTSYHKTVLLREDRFFFCHCSRIYLFFPGRILSIVSMSGIACASIPPVSLRLTIRALAIPLAAAST